MQSVRSSTQFKQVNSHPPVNSTLNPSQISAVSQAATQDSAEFTNVSLMINQVADELPQDNPRLQTLISALAKQLSGLNQCRQAELGEKEVLTNRLSTLLKALPAGVVVLDARGLVKECNPAAVELLGEPLTGERWVDIIDRSFSPRADDGHEVSLKDGRRLNIQTRSLESGYGQLILMSDLTETRTLQEGLARHQRLSAMGKTVASLAHQIRTPLSAAMLFAEHLSSPNLSPHLRIKCAQKLVSRLGHLEQQVRDMLLFAKGDTPVAEAIDINTLLREIQTVAEEQSAMHGIRFEWEIASVQTPIVGNKDALIGALMNLLNNAIEACSDCVYPVIRVTLAISRNHIVISVADNGAGFESVNGLKLTEAFFTTKSNGTGLGLAVVKSVAKAHHGQFFILSKGVGKGAEAIFTLPVKLPAECSKVLSEEIV